MKILKTEFEGLLIVEPKVFEDNRGYFYESYNVNKFKEAGLEHVFVQDNQSKSSYGVVRGLHYQLEPYAQTKLVRALYGKILDVVVDIRKNSQSFGKWISLEISDENKKQLLIPKGFAHGFAVLSDIAVILYKCDEFYYPEADRGINYNDRDLNINWGLNPMDIKVSEKDKLLPVFKHSVMNFK